MQKFSWFKSTATLKIIKVISMMDPKVLFDDTQIPLSYLEA